MLRPMVILVLLGACGSAGVCAGCGGDDGEDAPPSSLAYAATWESSSIPNATPDNHCFSISGNAISGAFIGFDSDAPARGSRTCEAAVDDGDSWLVVCPAVPGGGPSRSDVRLAKARDSGTETVYFEGATPCTDTFRMTTIDAE